MSSESTKPNGWVACIYICFLFVILVSGLKVSGYYQHKHHGVHSSDFILNGNFTITDKIVCNKIEYSVHCFAETEYFGECTYKSFVGHSRMYAEEVATNDCYANNTFYGGFISTEKKRCTLNNPNNKIYDTLLIFHIFLGLFLITCVGHIIKYYHYNSNVTESEQKNQELIILEEQI